MGAVNNSEFGSVYLGTDGLIHSVISEDIPKEKLHLYITTSIKASFAAPYKASF